MYCAAGGIHKTSYRKTSYTTATCMNISLKASSISCCELNSTDIIEPVSFVLASYHRSCLLSALLNSSQLVFNVCCLWQLKLAPNCLWTRCKKALCCQATQLVPAKLTSHLLWITVWTREERTTAFAFRPFPERLKEESVQQGTWKRRERKQKQIFCLSYIYYRK